jgi:hypothetical protein
MKHFIVPVALAAALSAGAVSPLPAASARQNISHGTLGKGTVTLWQQGTQLGVTIDKAAFASLPAKETRVDLIPQNGAFRLVEIDWHPHGHPPAGVYTVPHFDAHFYVIPKSERDAIAFAAPGSVPKAADAIVPMGYITDGTVEPQMGMHYVSASQPEFHGKPFMASQIWGYNKGHFAFVEAMFSLKFVNAKQSWTQAIPRPKNAGIAAGLPTSMSVGRNAAGGYDIVVSK